MAPALLTVFAAGLLGGGIAAEITVMIVVAAVALVTIGVVNGFHTLFDVFDLRRD
jgi:hypothetical protein